MRDETTQPNPPPEAPPPSPRPEPRRWWALALLCTTTFMIVLDTATVTTALPTIQADLGFSSAGLQWVVTAYTVTFGSLMLLGGRLADLFGRRRVFLAGNVIFLAASVVCGLAVSSEMLIVGRVLQGAGGAVVMPAGLSLLMTLFEEGAARNRALGFWATTSSGGGILGLVVGGPLTDGPGWPWIFLMNLPMGAVVLALTPVLLPALRDHHGRPVLDLAGAVTVTGTLVAFVAAMSTAPAVGWAHPRTLGLLVASVVLLVLFVRIESRIAVPLVPLRLFRSRSLVGGNLVLVSIGMASGGMPFVLTLYTQRVLGWTATQFALAMLAVAVTQIAGFALGQRLATRTGPRRATVIGTVVAAVALVPLLRLPVEGLPVGWFLAALALYGVGFGASAIAAQIAALAGTAAEDAGLAGGLSESAPMLGVPVGIALLSSVAVTRTDWLIGGGIDALVAEVAGYRLAMGAAMVITLLGLLAAVLLLRPLARGDA